MDVGPDNIVCAADQNGVSRPYCSLSFNAGGAPELLSRQRAEDICRMFIYLCFLVPLHCRYSHRNPVMLDELMSLVVYEVVCADLDTPRRYIHAPLPAQTYSSTSPLESIYEYTIVR